MSLRWTIDVVEAAFFLQLSVILLCCALAVVLFAYMHSASAADAIQSRCVLVEYGARHVEPVCGVAQVRAVTAQP
jgi:hypothetical protein